MTARVDSQICERRMAGKCWYFSVSARSSDRISVVSRCRGGICRPGSPTIPYLAKPSDVANELRNFPVASPMVIFGRISNIMYYGYVLI